MFYFLSHNFLLRFFNYFKPLVSHLPPSLLLISLCPFNLPSIIFSTISFYIFFSSFKSLVPLLTLLFLQISIYQILISPCSINDSPTISYGFSFYSYDTSVTESDLSCSRTFLAH
jgi:hypothetical protein